MAKLVSPRTLGISVIFVCIVTIVYHEREGERSIEKGDEEEEGVQSIAQYQALVRDASKVFSANDVTRQLTGRLAETPVACVSAKEIITELHYFWCAPGNFHFRHYLAITSSVDRYQPQLVHFHAVAMPRSAPFVFEWFEDLKRRIMFLELHENKDAECIRNTSLPSLKYLKSVIHPEYRTIIVQQDTVVNSRYRECSRFKSKSIFVSSKLALSSPDVKQAFSNTAWSFVHCKRVTFKTLDADSAQKCADNVSPSSLCDRDLTHDRDACLQFASDIFVRQLPLSPMSIAAFARYNFYGTSSLIHPVTYDVDVVPKVAHYVYMSTEAASVVKELKFGFYMSILSVLGVANVTCVYVHGNVQFAGPYWDDLMQRHLCVRHHFRPYPTSVWQQKRYCVEHWADVVRAQIFIQYGGLHADPDVYFYQPIPDDYWRHEAVIGLDAHVAAPGFSGNVPYELQSQINLGVCMSSPGSRFFQLYQDTHKQFDGTSWWHNSGEKPLQVYERHPHLALLSTRLEVVCPGGRCYPSWARTHAEAELMSHNPQYWYDKGIAIHTVWPDIDELFHPRYIGNSTTVYGTIANTILKASGTSLQHVMALSSVAKPDAKSDV